MKTEQALTALRALRAAADRTLRRSIHDNEREALDVAIAVMEELGSAKAAHDTNPTPKTPPQTQANASGPISENDNNQENTETK